MRLGMPGGRARAVAQWYRLVDFRSESLLERRCPRTQSGSRSVPLGDDLKDQENGHRDIRPGSDLEEERVEGALRSRSVAVGK